MANLMDSTPFNSTVNAQNPQNVEALIQQIRQNPSMFEEQIRRNNPQGYQMLLQIRNSPNPQALLMQMVQTRGVNPNILGMLGIR